MKIAWSDGQTQIVNEGRFPKFVSELQQISYSGCYAAELGQDVLFITERAVFRRGPNGLILTEIAPGVDLDKDILALMGFQPEISPQLKEMDKRIFSPEKMGYLQDLQKKPRLNLPIRLRK
jgi:propionate CoA-transferase